MQAHSSRSHLAALGDPNAIDPQAAPGRTRILARPLPLVSCASESTCPVARSRNQKI